MIDIKHPASRLGQLAVVTLELASIAGLPFLLYGVSRLLG